MFSVADTDALIKIINGTLSYCDKFSEFELLKLIHLHNVPGRIKKCILLYDLEKFFSAEFMHALHNMYHEFCDSVFKNIESVQKITNGNYDKNLPIVIKGFSNYILTNDKTVIRQGDVDIMPPDTQEFISTVKQMGYHCTKAPFMHEAGEYSKGEIELDIHEFFPIYRYDDRIKNILFCVNAKYDMPYEKVGFKQLETHTLVSDHNKGIRVADANMMVLIICSHSFMNYTNIWSISHREKSYIKLGELWDIFDLVKHSSYSTTILLDLAKQYHAEDCINWTGIVLKMFFGKNPLPCFGSENMDININFPKCIWWHLWTSIPTQKAQFMSDDWYDIASIFNKTGYNHLSNGPYNSDDLEVKFITGDVNLMFEIQDDYICVKRNPETGVKLDSHYRFDFGTKAIELTLNDSGINIGGDNKDINVSVDNSNIMVKLVDDLFWIGYTNIDIESTGEIMVPIALKKEV